jgi:mannan endo-1,4-beta-mannosidase
VTGSDEAAFAGLKKDQAIKVSIPETVTYGGKDFNVTAVEANALMDTRVTGVVVGDNVVTIGKYAFEDCAKLKSVTLGAKVTTIGTKAFKECGKLAKITIKSTALESVGKKAFSGIKSTARIKVPAGRLSAYKALLKGKGQGKKVKIFT